MPRLVVYTPVAEGSKRLAGPQDAAVEAHPREACVSRPGPMPPVPEPPWPDSSGEITGPMRLAGCRGRAGFDNLATVY